MHPELSVAVEMLSSVVLINGALDVGDRPAVWRQLASPVTGLSNVEDDCAQRWAEGLCVGWVADCGGGKYVGCH